MLSRQKESGRREDGRARERKVQARQEQGKVVGEGSLKFQRREDAKLPESDWGGRGRDSIK